jgi:hypothetical protein
LNFPAITRMRLNSAVLHLIYRIESLPGWFIVLSSSGDPAGMAA